MADIAEPDFWAIYRNLLWHWRKVDEFLASTGPFRLHQGLAQADAAALYLQYEAALEEAAAGEIADGLLRCQEQDLRRELGAAVVAFNAKVRAEMGASPFARVLATAPPLAAGREALLRPLRATATLWEKIEAAPPGSFQPPLILREGTDRATFTTQLAALESVLDAREAEALEEDLRRTREADQRAFGESWIPAYRAALPPLLPRGHALARVLPRYRPAEAPRPPGPPRRRGRPPKHRKKAGA